MPTKQSSRKSHGQVLRYTFVDVDLLLVDEDLVLVDDFLSSLFVLVLAVTLDFVLAILVVVAATLDFVLVVLVADFAVVVTVMSVVCVAQ